MIGSSCSGSVNREELCAQKHTRGEKCRKEWGLEAVEGGSAKIVITLQKACRAQRIQLAIRM